MLSRVHSTPTMIESSDGIAAWIFVVWNIFHQVLAESPPPPLKSVRISLSNLLVVPKSSKRVPRKTFQTLTSIFVFSVYGINEIESALAMASCTIAS